MLTTILLDLDGTLLDSNDAHASSWAEALHEFDYDIDFQQVRRLIGMGTDHLLPKLTGVSSESSRGEHIAHRRGEIFKEKYLPYLKPFPFARELVERMILSGYKLVVATSAGKEDLDGLLKQIGIDDLINCATSADDAESSKPSPDIVIEALKKAKASPHESIMLGDTPYDIKAAHRAGVRTVALTSGGWKEEELKDAIAIYKNTQDLLNNFDKSIFSRDREVTGSLGF